MRSAWRGSDARVLVNPTAEKENEGQLASTTQDSATTVAHKRRAQISLLETSSSAGGAVKRERREEFSAGDEWPDHGAAVPHVGTAISPPPRDEGLRCSAIDPSVSPLRATDAQSKDTHRMGSTLDECTSTVRSPSEAPKRKSKLTRELEMLADSPEFVAASFTSRTRRGGDTNSRKTMRGLCQSGTDLSGLPTSPCSIPVGARMITNAVSKPGGSSLMVALVDRVPSELRRPGKRQREIVAAPAASPGSSQDENGSNGAAIGGVASPSSSFSPQRGRLYSEASTATTAAYTNRSPSGRNAEEEQGVRQRCVLGSHLNGADLAREPVAGGNVGSEVLGNGSSSERACKARVESPPKGSVQGRGQLSISPSARREHAAIRTHDGRNTPGRRLYSPMVSASTHSSGRCANKIIDVVHSQGSPSPHQYKERKIAEARQQDDEVHDAGAGTDAGAAGSNDKEEGNSHDSDSREEGEPPAARRSPKRKSAQERLLLELTSSLVPCQASATGLQTGGTGECNSRSDDACS